MHSQHRKLEPRQIWANPTTTSSLLPPSCTPSILPSGGLINVGSHSIVTLTQDAFWQPYCSGTPIPQPIDPMQPGIDLSILNYQEPFYSSTNPQIYAIAAMTVVSYMLVIILFITPRTVFMGGAGGGMSRLGQNNMLAGSYGSNSVIGVGSRPWLQKVATLAVAISLTIVTVDTFSWAEAQYNAGYEDAVELSNNVIDGLEVRIVRVISETFLWLAQAQTLIRLFPRHKEKLIIKWTAFGLILADVIFDILNQFVDKTGKHHPRTFVTAIPALSYLFALSLNLCYALFVSYYAVCKRRYAFYRPTMRNMPLLALLSLIAILIPIIFFVIDLSAPNVSGWGSYIRWVGAAAASVVVWEWVERIEALERDEKRDGILGREIFDGDEMLEATPSSNLYWPSSRKRYDNRDGRGGGPRHAMSTATGWGGISKFAQRIGKVGQSKVAIPARRISKSVDYCPHRDGTLSKTPAITFDYPQPTPPTATTSPISRTDTISAASTEYVVRYHPASEPTPTIDETPESLSTRQERTEPERSTAQTLVNVPETKPQNTINLIAGAFSRMQTPFKRQRTTPPLVVTQAMAGQALPSPESKIPSRHTGLSKILTSRNGQKAKVPPGPVIVIPAPPRRKPSYSELAGTESTVTETPRPPISRSGSDNRPSEAVMNAINSSRAVSSLSIRGHTAPSETSNPGFSRSGAQSHEVVELAPVEPESRNPDTVMPIGHINARRIDHDI